MVEETICFCHHDKE